MNEDIKDGWNLILCRFSEMHRFFTSYIFGVLPNAQCYGPKNFFITSSFILLLVVIAISCAQLGCICQQRREKEEKISISQTIGQNKDNNKQKQQRYIYIHTNTHTHIYIYFHIYLDECISNLCMDSSSEMLFFEVFCE